MFKKQITAQRIITLLVLACCVFAFIASLGFLTGAYDVLRPGISQRRDAFDGCRLYEEFQPINSQLTKTALIMLVVSLILFITNTHSRRKYYVTNFIAVGVVSAVNLGISINSIRLANLCKTRFLNEVDFEKLKELAERPTNTKYVYSKSTFWYDLVTVASILVIIATVLLIALTVFKIVLMQQEKKLIKQGEGLVYGE